MTDVHAITANNPADAHIASASRGHDTQSALRFITCGSVDDGKSTLIGRLLVDSRSVLQDQLAGVQRQGQTDLALLTDGLSAEREQGITIDVAWRYFSTARRKFIIGDAPGHEQYTRNMVTAASNADAAVVLVDATKLPWASDASAPAPDANQGHGLLAQTRRHALLAQLLRVPALIFAVNKLDAVPDAALAWQRIDQALQGFARDADLSVTATVPISALRGWNVVEKAPTASWSSYSGPTLLQILEQLPVTAAPLAQALAFPVQWVEKFSDAADTAQGRRVFWGRVAGGRVQAGDLVQVHPGGQTAVVAQVLDATRTPGSVPAGLSAGLVLDRELDISRGDWLLADTPTPPWQSTRELQATVAWMDEEPLVCGRTYWALHGHRWVKTRALRILEQLNIHTLAREPASELGTNAIGRVELALQADIPALPYAQSRTLGAMILVDSASHRTSGAVLLA